MGISERRKYKATARWSYPRPLVLNALRLLWIVIVVWGEIGVYYWSLSSCRWPDKSLPQDASPTHILLISDPQVRPPRDFWEDMSWFASAREFFFELNLKRNWHVTRRLKPQTIFFLGDMLASGKYVHSEPEFEQYWQKFQNTFAFENGTDVYYLPGNNDFGMGASRSLSVNVRTYYKKYVGPLNQVVPLRGHNFVALDAPGLVDEDYRRSASGLPHQQWSPTLGGTLDFIKELDTQERSPVVLLSHIPLHRPDTATCGRLREKGTIRRGVGHGYQNTLGKETTYYLLDTLHPIAVFSGDNRDYCEYNHTSRHIDPETRTKISEESVREVTIKSFSMARNIHHPGFHLLSLVDPSPGGPSLADTACFLPDQPGLFSALYWPFVVITTLLLLFLNLRKGPGRIPGLVGRLTPASPYRGRHPTVWTPFTAAPESPKGSLPVVRTPTSSAGPQMKASSRPASPSALLHPSSAAAIAAADADEDEDETYPAQYATRRAAYEHDDLWSPRHNKGARSIDQEAADSYFLQQPAAPRHHGKRPWSWSFTFVFAQRRRRITLRAPTARGVKDAVGVLGCGADKFDAGLVGSTALDALSVLWVAVVVWALLAWRSS